MDGKMDIVSYINTWRSPIFFSSRSFDPNVYGLCRDAKTECELHDKLILWMVKNAI
jgi:hypothetical protein